MFGFNRLPKPLPPFEPDPSLVLRGGEHYHVSGICYEGLHRNGMNFTWSSSFEMTGNDVLVVAERARRIAHRSRVHISGVRVCSEKHAKE